ncbi:bifunctional serine/threonine-protein kinase/formylglycine-generating enzyme family protein [Prosthecobacter sp.]|uniref:bifunctional serine/threonine-protein kinase/formylglycine-generating enzyme family protein n=1 Tax=Prosthecobacter sp. TaxID=1965333 RepID=UPI002ABAFDDA|nr:bifunctional serine/threonine-protein kinase/formylglycine-generating enzyme family protein [Prosthecobacter sp.]MDZ4401162.1 bifunctional serine/threonine-protein kinase/formylglycine-generating enzyme family protein [Prosthecobacter sp.]
MSDATPSSPDSPPQRTTGGNFRWEPPTAEELQALMPGYTIEKLLGRGGMGAVYRGVQTNLDRTVAIKILPPGVEKEDPSFAERFKSEAKLMAKLNHPAVVAVYDFGTTLGGQLYFAMEYVDGSDVAQMIRAQGKLPPDHALAITAHVCDALAAAHELGIVHRDIKPANVLLNMKGQVKVADFGLAKVEEPGTHGLTKTGYAMGTPDFVAPEVLMLGTHIDGRADLYAVGVMLYQMLTGEVPRGAFKPASVRMPGLDRRYDPIIMKAMQSDREERYQSSAELRRDLDVILTVPLVQEDMPATAAIPAAKVAQVPAQRSAAQKPVGKPPQPKSTTDTPVRRDAAPAGRSAHGTSQPPAKSKTPLLIGIGVAAAIGIGAFVIFSGGKKPSGPSSSSVSDNSPSKTAPSKTQPRLSHSTEPWQNALRDPTKLSLLGGAAITPEGLRFTGASEVRFRDLGPRRDGAVRMLATFGGAHVQLRARLHAADLYHLYTKDEKRLALQRWDSAAKKSTTVREIPLLQALQPGQDYELELRVVGSTLTVKLNGEVLATATDLTYPEGPFSLSVTDQNAAPALVKALEVLDLDKPSGANATAATPPKADLPKSAVTSSPSPQVPARNASRSDAGGSASSTQQFPPGQWVKIFTKFEDLPTNLRKPDSGVKFEDGWIRFGNGIRPTIEIPGGSRGNFGVRLHSIRKGVTASAGDTIVLRRQSGSHYQITFTGGVLSCQRPASGQYANIFTAMPPAAPSPGQEYALEFAAVGERLIGRLGPAFVKVATNAQWKQGTSDLNFAEPVRDIEVINLDGISEAEALKILGVDEKGNDLRKPAAVVSSSPSLPVPARNASRSDAGGSASSEKFPPGQWVKVFAKFEDLPAQFQKAGSGVRLNDGKLEVDSTSTYLGLALAAGNIKNCAVRATIASDSFGLRMRDDPAGNDFYLFKAVSIEIGQRVTNGQPADLPRLVSFAAPPKTEQQWEFGAVGEMLVTRRSGNIIGFAIDARIKSGPVLLANFKGTIRDIEVINLDGLSEAEALRILGVDEKGNDTRAAALAAEKQAMAQQQVAQAAATIPELAALDAQFKQLTVERVTLPFVAEVAKLNSGYLGGLDRKMAEEKAAGHLDSVLAIEAEKKLIQGVGASSPQPGNRGQDGPAPCPLPSAEDDATSTTTPAALKTLRQIYREAYAKIEATRAANLKALTDPLTTRLKLLESDLTKKDRIADAKTVKEYREGLQSGPLSPLSGTSVAKAPEPAQGTVRTTLDATALKDGFTNSLGMKFVPVKDTDVLFCIHETRRQDYAAYATEVPGVDGSWKNQKRDGIPCGDKDDHPVVGVSWEDANKFCEWLSKKEGNIYRLPKDEEWSIAVGLGRAEKWSKNTTPELLSGKETAEFPWGGDFPPKTKDQAGNYADSAWHEKSPTSPWMEGYSDGFPTTAPVMSFKPNKLGIYDMGGNVWEWMEDWYNAAQKDRVLRGGSFNNFDRSNLLSSIRPPYTPDNRYSHYGFRVVLDTRSLSPTTKPGATTPPPVVPPPAPATAAKSDFSNSLGMKFVKVSGTQVFFCIHETRRQDYAAYAAEVPGADDTWKNFLRGGVPCGHEDSHPVVHVNWEDAQKFCLWLSQKEGRIYRLPADKEWSYAVGIGRDEKWTKDTTPESLSNKLQNVFPWGGDFPPKSKEQAGNYADTVSHEKFPSKPFIEDYTDGYATTAPVMSFKPNKLGLYDLGGNVWELCEDLYNVKQKDRVLRGASFVDSDRNLSSSTRVSNLPGYRSDGNVGFRIVVEMTAP